MGDFKKSYPSVLTIAGSDSGGGAGIQADLKTFSALGCFGTSVITATTAQNTKGVYGIHDIPVAHILDQLRAVLTDIYPKAIKVGMLSRPEIVCAIASELRNYPAIPIVFDPVMVATSGDRLINQETVDVIKSKLFPLSHIVTPNLDETAVLVGRDVQCVDAMRKAGGEILSMGPAHVLVKGGHLAGDQIVDFLIGASGINKEFEGCKIETLNTHGTGCTLSSAIAAYLARGLTMFESVAMARDYVLSAIEAGREVKVGAGHGPLNHFFEPQKLIKYEMV
ncbi:bifunctional hydroxymethylpyrimidine kinase/phosphomethylpyrimidine kinase [Echinicola shivajiensis]|uniref:bifunctional hydroxymethylpyrimidine kinase/phosphomethylpyrimidine kinase n=1 Tax=Echinicola shivajiensis TaxID=1035916 RepID=UPI001BFC6346|nr:bifunctional hydroxymethylpyrimidine kinase/phosphomethylpyrimidine kinase [Echinicola shivajiensis]